ncbi:CPBP family intramembrane glutamic endopeptidase [Methanocella sp. MCL-LM]|uniref:CPBP family intramembrane glutamic endopeptidase n=1 Tax=Methanocella sp. MCL-LM TaxID=3412035 RepID=UPI003C75A105
MIVIAFSVIGGLIFKAVMPESLAGSSLVMAFVAQNLDYIVPFGLMIAALAAWVLLREKRPLSTLGFSRKGAAGKYLTGMAGGIALYLFCMALLVAVGAVRIEQALAIEPISALLVLSGLAGFVVQGAAEEVLFRGWQLPAIAAKYGVPVAIGLSALTFTALHLIADVDSLLVFPFLFAFAILLSLYALYDRCIWGVCGFHAAWNWMDTNPFGIAGEGATFSTSLFSYMITGDLYYFVNIAAVIAGIGVLLALFAIRGRKAGKGALPGERVKESA